MSKIPTAEELAIKMFIKNSDAYLSFNRVKFTGKQLKAVAVVLSKLHAEAALKAAAEKAQTTTERRHPFLSVSAIVDKDSILNAYPLNNIV